MLFLWIMPDNQLNAKFLTENERLMAVERIRINQQGVGNKHFKAYQFKEAMTDPMVWAFVFYALGKYPPSNSPLHTPSTNNADIFSG